ncbi:MAG: hypothetical protein LBJ91_02690 [Clostridiales Family XIII bacterium]|jgi:hypothetical protein|nr:hypothetical protein [Clostridiales Family XIII bacterium]
MRYAPNYNLKIPEYDDNADISDIDDNFDAIDAILKTKTEIDEVEITLAASAWSSGVATISNEAIPTNPDGDVVVTLQEGATDAQEKAAGNATIKPVLGSQQAGSLQIRAQGVVPAIALPILLKIVKK